MVADANLFIRDDLAGLAKKRIGPEFMIGCTYKFRFSSLALPYSFIYTDKLSLITLLLNIFLLNNK